MSKQNKSGEMMMLNVKITNKDREILRKLAYRVAEIAEKKEQKEKENLWRKMNDLKMDCPVVAVYPERAWKELILEKEYACSNAFLQGFERALRYQIFQYEHIGDDRVITADFTIPWEVKRENMGIEIKSIASKSEGPHAIAWEKVIHNIEDVEKLKHTKLTVDRQLTYEKLEIAREIFGDILNMKIYGGRPFWSVGLAKLIMIRGLEQTMIDMYEEPEILHKIMAFLQQDSMKIMDFYENNKLLDLNNDAAPIEYFHGAGHEGFTNRLPKTSLEGRAVTFRDMWGLGEMQEFSSVGPVQFKEFSLDYQVPLLKRFGLVNYGCCEPLDHSYDDLIKEIPNLTRVSVTSPYADKEIAAQKLGDNVIFAWKPNPTPLAMEYVDWDFIRKDARETIEIAKNYNCNLEIIMKSTETFYGNHDNRIEKWVDVIKSEIGR